MSLPRVVGLHTFTRSPTNVTTVPISAESESNKQVRGGVQQVSSSYELLTAGSYRTLTTAVFALLKRDVHAIRC
jgi:hypothetical protein